MAKAIERPLPFSLAFFQRMTQHMTEHYDDGPHDDRDGNTPCDDEYCKVADTDEAIVRAMFEAMEPLVYKFIEQYDFTEHESFDALRERVRRGGKHEHVCGQRHTSGPVIVEEA